MSPFKKYRNVGGTIYVFYLKISCAQRVVFWCSRSSFQSVTVLPNTQSPSTHAGAGSSTVRRNQGGIESVPPRSMAGNGEVGDNEETGFCPRRAPGLPDEISPIRAQGGTPCLELWVL